MLEQYSRARLRFEFLGLTVCYFIFRINGALQNLSTHDTFSFANDSTKLNIFKPENRTDSDGVQVIVMAFQYKSGQYK